MGVPSLFSVVLAVAFCFGTAPAQRPHTLTGDVRFHKSFHSNILANDRDVIVYLPPGYEERSENYPSVYCLTGFTGRGKMLLNDAAFTPNLAERMDRLIDSGAIKPMIVVMPDCFTYYGGSQYINSAATGNY